MMTIIVMVSVVMMNEKWGDILFLGTPLLIVKRGGVLLGDVCSILDTNGVRVRVRMGMS